jgi:hypothetical protein
MTMTWGRSLALALVSALILFFAGLYIGGMHRTCTVAKSVDGWVPVCSNHFTDQMGN